MRKVRIVLAGVTFAALAFGSFGTAAAHNGCDETSPAHQHTAAGSCKDTDDHNIACGTTGRIGADVVDTSVHANNPSDGPQVEACNDGDAGNFNGRLLLQVSESKQGARVILDSDRDQPFDAGWITVQASADQDNATGVYCSRDPNESGVREGDGYRQSWATPGPDSGLPECAPNLPIP